MHDNCPVCDRPNCGRYLRVPWARLSDADGMNPHGSFALTVDECFSNAVDWRARALRAEAANKETS